MTEVSWITWDWAVQGTFLLRLVVALACGTAVGLERQRRRKKPGIRTHMIVCLASAAIMLVSKYGFLDLLPAGMHADPSRVAAGVVASIGFLGAGAIFYRKQTINGLTSAAGLWATMGIGLSIGAGMYLVGIVTTVLILFLQTVLRTKVMSRGNMEEYDVVLRLKNTSEALDQLRAYFRENDWKLIRFKAEKQGDTLVLDACIGLRERRSAQEMLTLLQNDYISAVEY